MKLGAFTERRVYRIVVLVPFLRREEMEIGNFSITHLKLATFLSLYMKVAGKPTNSIVQYKETVLHKVQGTGDRILC